MKVLLALAFFFTSCASNKDKDEDKDKPEAPDQQIVGRIALVSKVGKFVLIQKFGPGVLPANALYQSRGPDGRSAALRPSGERVRDFFAADLLNGSVERGDAVMAYKNPEEKNEEEPESPEKGENSEEIPSEETENSPSDDTPDPENINKEG